MPLRVYHTVYGCAERLIKIRGFSNPSEKEREGLGLLASDGQSLGVQPRGEKGRGASRECEKEVAPLLL